MSLTTYRDKRNFNSTPEPTGKAGRTGGLLRFVVQEHHASHLHYDFRLEMDGVLRSRAVPKGPSLDPSVKRLAMEVEDHPLSYIDFQGTIPKGNYGAGKVYVWDNGTYLIEHVTGVSENAKAVAAYRSGKIDFQLNGKKLRGSFALVKTKGGKGNQWLLIKHRDKFVSAKPLEQMASIKNDLTQQPMPTGIKPMLAILAKEPFDSDDWLFEWKWDGYRAIAEIDHGSVSIYSRNGLSFNKKFAPLVKELTSIRHRVVLDGEVVALDENQRPSFQRLQIIDQKPSTLKYVVFDILYVDGADVRLLPLIKRRELLELVVRGSGSVMLSPVFKKKGKALFTRAQRQNREGIIAKRKDSSYTTGRRSEYWLKIKSVMRQEAVIGGFTLPRGSRKKIGALILGVYENGLLQYIGHTGGGFNDELLTSVYKKLNALKTTNSPFAKKPRTNMTPVWVRPEVVCEVSFSEWTADGHMRHPIFVGLRPDKSPADVHREFPHAQTITKNYMTTATKPRKKANTEFTNLDKIFFPKLKKTKGDVISFYRQMAPVMLPYLKGRPHVLLRHPHGIDGKSFYQKDLGDLVVPDFVRTTEVYSESNNKLLRYLVCDNKETILYMAQLGCIELSPFSSTVDTLDSPDYSIIDIDAKEVNFKTAVAAANVVHHVLEKASIVHYCKTSGKSGLHFLLPLKPGYSYEQSKQLAELVCRLAHRELPNITSLERDPKKRKKKIYLDFLQNRHGQTIAAPYCLRPVPEATVSCPIEFNELTAKLKPTQFTIKTMTERFEKKGDLWKDFFKKQNDLSRVLKAMENVL